jgi:hypothetical protein
MDLNIISGLPLALTIGNLVNVFRGIERNPLFCGILVTTSILQVLIVEFGSIAFHVKEGGLPWSYWLLTVGIGFLSLPVQQVINVLYSLGLNYNGFRNKRRLRRNASLSRRSANNEHHYRE